FDGANAFVSCKVPDSLYTLQVKKG
ncbi:MAG: hypothetical protein ACI943_001769, partial [Gammaproteobacteria bacterium]